MSCSRSSCSAKCTISRRDLQPHWAAGAGERAELRVCDATSALRMPAVPALAGQRQRGLACRPVYDGPSCIRYDGVCVPSALV